MKRTLTARFVRGIKAAAVGRRVDYWDDKVPGLGVRVTERGAKAFVLYTRWPGTGKPARRRIGDASRMDLAVARRKARAWIDLVANGIDPEEQKRQDALEKQRERDNTFAVVAEAWLVEVVIGPDRKRPLQRKGPEVERDVRREFVARWGNRPITSITTLDIRNVVKQKATTTPAQARNLLGYARRLFAWAVAQLAYGLAESPAERLVPRAIVGPKVRRRRVLREPELRALWSSSEQLGYPYGRVFEMLALTGQRKSEVAEARWREFDLDKKLWTIPPERMKMDGAHAVPLSDDAIALLEELPRFRKGDHLFSTTFGAKPVNGFSKAKARLDRLMLAELIELEPFTIHDIRRTMRTHLSALPVQDVVREAVIAHARPGMHGVYDHFEYLDEKRQALDLWAARLRGIVQPASDNVVPMRREVQT
jgi:integrase